MNLNKKLITAIIGHGVVGKRRRNFIEKNKNYKLMYISDIKYKKNFYSNKIFFFKDYKYILNLKVDVVFVTLPNYLAPIVTKAFLKKKVHVFCEKPPGKTVADIKSIIKVEKKLKKIKLKYGFNHRYHGSIMLAKKIISNEQFGKILNIRAVYGKSKIITYNKNEWRAKKKYSGGGILIDQGIHLLDLLRYFNGDFLEIKSFISNKFWNHDVEDNAFAIMIDSKGVIASIHSSATQWQHKFMIEITLEKSLIILSGILSGSKSYGKEKLIIILRDQTSKRVNTFKKDLSWKLEIDEFADIILKNKKVEIGSSHDALKVMQMVEKIYKESKK